MHTYFTIAYCRANQSLPLKGRRLVFAQQKLSKAMRAFAAVLCITN